MKFYPSPGIVVIEPVKDTKANWGDKKDTKIKQGKVIAVGGDVQTDFGAELLMQDYAKVGDIQAYLTYAGEYDESFIGNQEYHWVKVQDLRGRIDGK